MSDTTSLFQPLTFVHGPSMKNRLMLAPLTNLQSHVDGTLSDDEYHWLTLRAKGGFGLTMTCATHVQQVGQGFPGQLGIWSDDHLPGLTPWRGRAVKIDMRLWPAKAGSSGALAMSQRLMSR